jgi:hypothetical protein
VASKSKSGKLILTTEAMVSTGMVDIGVVCSTSVDLVYTTMLGVIGVSAARNMSLAPTLTSLPTFDLDDPAASKAKYTAYE